MDKLDRYRDAIERILTEYAQIRYSYGNLENRLLFDRERDQYAIISLGWNEKHREHGVVAHLEIKDGKVWIQEDNTESGVATDLEPAGIPKEDIVLGFRHPQLRPYTEYAVR
ncbi:MAG TPA: XisI protein [Blastocatellia bacterium]|nr:XisI protein [Blastocatellia bacterium]